MTLHTKIRNIQDELNQTYFERSQAIEMILLTLLSGEHGYLVGTPGTAKSAIVCDLVSRLTGAQYFETLLFKLLPAEAVLGPLDLPRLSTTGDFVRKDKGFLTTADVAFLDEMGNMGSTYGHALHSIANERKFNEVDGDGRSSRSVPLSSMFGAGNQTLVEESDEAAALWDRILLRWKVENIKSNGTFVKLFDETEEGVRTTVDWAELKQAIDFDIPAIPIPDSVKDQIVEIKEKLADLDNPIILSDRRWKAARKVLKASAWLRGATEVGTSDLTAFKYMAWSDEGEIKSVERVVLDVADKVSAQIKMILDDLMKIDAGIKEREGRSRDDRGAHGRSTKKKLDPENLQKIRRIKIENPNHPEIPALEKAFNKAWKSLFRVCADMETAPKVEF